MFILLFPVLFQGFQDYFPDSFLPKIKPVSTLMHQAEVCAGEPYRAQEEGNSLILDVKTEPDLLDIHSFIYSDEQDDFSSSEHRWGCDSEQENDYTSVQCDDGLETLTIIKEEPSEEDLSFCAELQSSFKPESIEISIVDEEEEDEEEEEGCDTLLVENEEVNMSGTSLMLICFTFIVVLL